MQKFDVAVIGGGAAGLACAVGLRERNKNLTVAVFEAGERAGRKIAASGNGQGNVSNADMSASHYRGSCASLAGKLCCSGLYNPLSLFDFLFTEDKSGRIYPAGKQASALVDCLLRRVETAGVKLCLSCAVKSLSKGFNLVLVGGEKIAADRVVIATGGKAQRQFGSDGSGYEMVKQFGHSVTPLYPSLVQLKCDARYIKSLKGIRAECRVSAFGGNGKLIKSTVGDVIFTDYGVSGNAIFYISSYCAGRDDVNLSLEFLPEISEERIAESVRARLAAGYPESELLSGTLHNQIGRAVIRRCGGDPEAIARTVKNFTLKVVGTLGFDYAQVTKGGVPADETDDGLQSKLVKNLYFAGEILDVDGDCGGYNLTWAFCSGLHVAHTILKETAGND